MENTQEQAHWPCDCHPGSDRPLSHDTTKMVWALLLEHSGMTTGASDHSSADRTTAKCVAAAWVCADDADLWGLLANLMDAHPEWSANHCEELLRAWVNVRANIPGQASLLNHWRQRWQRQHRSRLKRELTQAGNMSWAQRCRYCEVWSVNRQIMPPFCGIAEILLNLAEKTTAPQPSKLLTNSLYREGFVYPAASANETEAVRGSLNKEIIVITPHETIDDFSGAGPSRQLLWALENSGYSWSLRQPWDKDINLDPSTVRGAIIWSYRHRHKNFVPHAMGFERTCQLLHIPVVNSILSGWDARHSTILKKWQHAGIPCPRFQKFTNVEDIELPYPLILRVDGVHRGQEMHLVQNANEAKALVSSKRTDFLASGRGPRVWPSPNLAVEFVDISNENGLYHKYRAYIAGSSLVMRHHMMNKNWLVNFALPELSRRSGSIHRDITPQSKQDRELILRAGRISGSEVTALDYSRTQNGGYMFWEANRHFGMNGDKNYKLPESISESKLTRMAMKDRELGDLLLKLLRERFGNDGDTFDAPVETVPSNLVTKKYTADVAPRIEFGTRR
ncbi:hypothetical protein ACFL2V_01555 [Pseudomonadota bacterium]